MTAERTENPQGDSLSRRPAQNLLAVTGLRATQQRLVLTAPLFNRGARHVGVETLHDELVRWGAPGSISSIYRGPRDFSDMGLLRRIPVYGSTTWYDTQTGRHHHFYAVDENRLMDVPTDCIAVQDLPPPPEGYELISVDVLLRVRRKEGLQAA